MTWSHTISQVAMLAVVCTCVTGCVWVGDSVVWSPEFKVHGQLLNANGQIIAEKECFVDVDIWTRSHSQKLMDTQPDPLIQSITDSYGRFTAICPSRKHREPACGIYPPFIIIARAKNIGIVLYLRPGAAGTPYYELFFHDGKLVEATYNTVDNTGACQKSMIETGEAASGNITHGEEADELFFTLRLCE